MHCEEWSRLMEKYSVAVKAYGNAVSSAGGLSPADFDIALKRAERARSACQEAEQAMHEHEQQHGCFRRTLRATA